MKKVSVRLFQFVVITFFLSLSSFTKGNAQSIITDDVSGCGGGHKNCFCKTIYTGNHATYTIGAQTPQYRTSTATSATIKVYAPNGKVLISQTQAVNNLSSTSSKGQTKALNSSSITTRSASFQINIGNLQMNTVYRVSVIFNDGISMGRNLMRGNHPSADVPKMD
jgi:hypothetical protein